MKKIGDGIQCYEPYAKTKGQISCVVSAQLISTFVLALSIVQSLYFLTKISSLEPFSVAVQLGLCRI